MLFEEMFPLISKNFDNVKFVVKISFVFLKCIEKCKLNYKYTNQIKTLQILFIKYLPILF